MDKRQGELILDACETSATSLDASSERASIRRDTGRSEKSLRDTKRETMPRIVLDPVSSFLSQETDSSRIIVTTSIVARDK